MEREEKRRKEKDEGKKGNGPFQLGFNASSTLSSHVFLSHPCFSINLNVTQG